jgi:exosortase D (VPLPA-CTERM-specific)
MRNLRGMARTPADPMAGLLFAGERRLRPYRVWLGALAAAVLLAALYHESLAYLVYIWSTDENYGHGWFVPLISGYLIWGKRHLLARHLGHGSWWGLLTVAAALVLYVVGRFATLYVVLHLSFWLMLVGLFAAVVGLAGVRAVAFPVGYLLTMIPLPHFLYQGLSSRLQLISSSLGVSCLQLVGVTAFRDGNVIDLGPIQLQVVEACSGLRYVFPLASLALLCAYLFKDRLWKRVLLFLSSIPISIVLNGLRIGMIGVLVDFYGEGMAEGFSHLFEGWLIFVVSVGLLFLEIRILAGIGAPGPALPLSSLLRLPNPGIVPAGQPEKSPPGGRWLTPGAAYLACMAVLIPAALASGQGVSPEERIPPRSSFVDFPLRLDGWTGMPLVMEQVYRETLRFDDYLLADYRRSSDMPVNLYLAYYRSQKAGQSAHSPRTCIPGGGWEIVSVADLTLAGSPPIIVNRVQIHKDDQKQLVLYWFQERGRILASEYAVKWYLLWDAVTRHRSDGALVRLTTAIDPGETDAVAEARLVAFAETIRPFLSKYVPD